MKPFFILTGTFVVSLIGFMAVYGEINYALSGRIAMTAMLAFTAIGHFAFRKGMTMMIPDFIAYKNSIIVLTGLIEIAAGVGLLIPSLQQLTSWLLIIFFILILPANIYTAMRNIDYQKGTFDGPGLRYLWLRIPLQVFFILWVLWFGLLMEPVTGIL